MTLKELGLIGAAGTVVLVGIATFYDNAPRYVDAPMTSVMTSVQPPCCTHGPPGKALRAAARSRAGTSSLSVLRGALRVPLRPTGDGRLQYPSAPHRHLPTPPWRGTGYIHS